MGQEAADAGGAAPTVLLGMPALLRYYRLMAFVLSGLLGGIALGMKAPRPRDGQGIPFVTACLIAGLAGSVGCLLYGLVGLGVMLAGLFLGAAPVLATRRA